MNFRYRIVSPWSTTCCFWKNEKCSDEHRSHLQGVSFAYVQIEPPMSSACQRTHVLIHTHRYKLSSLFWIKLTLSHHGFPAKECFFPWRATRICMAFMKCSCRTKRRLDKHSWNCAQRLPHTVSLIQGWLGQHQEMNTVHWR